MHRVGPGNNERVGNEIVVVEDDELTRDLISELLRDRGHTVQPFGSVQGARWYLEGKGPPALLVLDVTLPDGEGLDLIPLAKSLHGPSAPPVLVISGLRSESAILRGYAAGADDYLTKPFKPAQLQAKVAVLLARRPGLEETRLEPSLPGKGGLDFGRYERRGVLGKGSSGTVYEARDTVESRIVALKVLSALKSREAEYRFRFLRESYSISAVDHPGVVRVYDFGNEEGRLYYSMELLKGPSLAERAAERSLTAAETVEVMLPLAEALSSLGSRDLVHRDLKPSNIVLRHGGLEQPVLIGFGLSKLTFDRGLTEANVVLGTAGYVAPEVLSGGQHDHRSDLYALGMVARFALAGEDLWPGVEPFAIFRRQLSRDIPLPDLPAPFAEILRKLLARDPADRFQEGEDLVVDLKRAQTEMASPQPEGRECP